MRLLLDTHAFLWFVVGDTRLSDYPRALILDPANERLLSVASLWEMAIKASLVLAPVSTFPRLCALPPFAVEAPVVRMLNISM